MAERKSFLLRIDPRVLEAVQRWANDDLRSLNAHIEYLLRQSLQRAGRLKPISEQAASEPQAGFSESETGRPGGDAASEPL